MAKNTVKKCFRYADLKSCLDNKFKIDKAFLNKLHGRDDLLPDRLEETLRSKLDDGKSAEATSDFLRHIEDYYKTRNVRELCDCLDELSAEKPIYEDVAKEIRKTFKFWKEAHIDLTSESSETAEGLKLYEVEREHTGYSSKAQNLHKKFQAFIRYLANFVEQMGDADFTRFRNLCYEEIDSRYPMAKEHEPIVLTTNRSMLVSELKHHRLWRNCLAYEDLRTVLSDFDDMELSKVLNDYEQHVIANVEEILDIYNDECEEDDSYYHIKFKKDRECVIGEINKLRRFLMDKIGIAKTSFNGLRRGCVEICFIILDVAVNPQQLQAKFLESDNLMFLRELNIHSAKLPGAWTLSTRDVTHSKGTSQTTLKHDNMQDSSIYGSSQALLEDIQKIQLDGKSVKDNTLDDSALKFPKVAVGDGFSQVVIGVDRLTLPKSYRYGVHRYLSSDYVKAFNPRLVESSLKEFPIKTSSEDITPEISRYKVSATQSLPHGFKEKSEQSRDSYTPSIEVH